MEIFTEDEIKCLKEMICKFRQDKMMELYNKRQHEETMVYRTMISGDQAELHVSKPQTFLDKAKEYVSDIKAFIITTIMVLSVIVTGINFNKMISTISVTIFFIILCYVVYKTLKYKEK